MSDLQIVQMDITVLNIKIANNINGANIITTNPFVLRLLRYEIDCCSSKYNINMQVLLIIFFVFCSCNPNIYMKDGKFLMNPEFDLMLLTIFTLPTPNPLFASFAFGSLMSLSFFCFCPTPFLLFEEAEPLGSLAGSGTCEIARSVPFL